MSNKKYSPYELQEIHGEHIDLQSVRFHDSHTEVQMDVHSDKEGAKVVKKAKIDGYNYNDLWKVFLVETTACITFMLIENYGKGNSSIYISGLFLLLMTLYPVSGCNMNASVSLSLWWYEEEFNKIHTIRRFSYIFFFQPLGLFLGQLLSIWLIADDVIYTKPKPYDPYKIAFCEFFCCGAVIFAALHCIVSRYTRPTNQIGINFMIFTCILYFTSNAGYISGGSGNPTKYLITQAFAFYRGIEPNAFSNWYCYIFPQMIGATAFTAIFKWWHEPLYYRMLTLKGKWEDGFYPEKYLKD